MSGANRPEGFFPAFSGRTQCSIQKWVQKLAYLGVFFGYFLSFSGVSFPFFHRLPCEGLPVTVVARGTPVSGCCGSLLRRIPRNPGPYDGARGSPVRTAVPGPCGSLRYDILATYSRLDVFIGAAVRKIPPPRGKAGISYPRPVGRGYTLPAPPHCQRNPIPLSYGAGVRPRPYRRSVR